jgi:hypothetical protein
VVTLITDHANKQDKKVSEDAPIQYKQVLGVGFLPAKAKRPYFVPFTIHDITSYLSASPVGEIDSVHVHTALIAQMTSHLILSSLVVTNFLAIAHHMHERARRW